MCVHAVQQKPSKAGVALAGAQHGGRCDALMPATAPGPIPKCRVSHMDGSYYLGGLGFRDNKQMIAGRRLARLESSSKKRLLSCKFRAEGL